MMSNKVEEVYEDTDTEAIVIEVSKDSRNNTSINCYYCWWSWYLLLSK